MPPPKIGTTGDSLTIRLFVGGSGFASIVGAIGCAVTGGTVAFIAAGFLLLVGASLGAWAIWWPAIAVHFPIVSNRAKRVVPMIQAFAVPLLVILILGIGFDLYVRTGQTNPLPVVVDDPAQAQRIGTLESVFTGALQGKSFVVPQGLPHAGETIRLKRASVGNLFNFDPKENPTQAFTAVVEDNKDDPVVDALLQGRLFFIPKGYPYEHEFAAVTPISHTDAAKRTGPCMKFKDTGTVKGKEWTCEGHPTAVDADHVKSFELDKSTTK